MNPSPTGQMRDLYQEVILDHNHRPRNFRKMPDANRRAEGHNPLCGDQITVYLKWVNGVIEEVTFEGAGCAISKASSSLMTSAVKGKGREEVEGLFNQFHRLVTGAPAVPGSPDLGKLAVFAGVRDFPGRVKCATLPWHALRAALDQKGEIVSTEKEEDNPSLTLPLP